MTWTQLSQPEAVLLAAAIAATGAIIGGSVASILTQWMNGRATLRRQWDESRHAAYARVSETFHAALGLYDDTGRLRSGRPAERSCADELLAAYSRAILLTRSDATAAALEQLHDAAQDLWDRPARPWPEIDEQCRIADWKFRKEARAEMGLPTRHGLIKPRLATPTLPTSTPTVVPAQPAGTDPSGPGASAGLPS